MCFLLLFAGQREDEREHRAKEEEEWIDLTIDVICHDYACTLYALQHILSPVCVSMCTF